ncbi:MULTISPECIES: UDP-N-acetylglucosamine 1-carboxyvinyltransferase [Sneathia]|uniref:UDP-N-acetylglucosamine 1-carboxyvinyltransferase n=1 Tax=Sneathia vaginalis TaxID=187101 RepID=A0A0E3ZAE2_9FUSO|nr:MULTISPECIES: UDP-N-acetylglucosamine 1-carboxyvinyltransferase [Sneathia]AKC95857.1 UDP-N-acetylglucosamine 1-carboxyvinyltransferase [Sneathia vaginalis]MBE2989987.1 UDP-N-acetylglucosamine 1-carboxyvinyltransferase [Sneathia sp. DSM 16630]MBE3030812.1 UDP-N-acetylglucosamine 1-carboxyvinyltransferase [Sneathia sp. DSM 16631]MDK9581397.1 UDP-N-acetylglucosamine 1-carboxyvinyltransferase [Sneathia vaginalis]
MVDGFVITGGKPLNGVIEVSGAKNAALPIIIATLIEKGKYTIKNVPNLSDIRVLFKLLESLGLKVTKIGDHEYEILNNGITNNKAEYEIVKKMRASFLVMGPMVANLDEAIISLPGGCSIGSRPVDLHLFGFEKLGAKIIQEHGYVYVDSSNLKGDDIVLSFPSVGATQNILIAATKIKGTTRIINAAKEPEIVDLGKFLIKMGAKIKGLGTDEIEIEGVEKLHAVEYSIMPDRIETATYVIASLVTEGQMYIKNGNLEDLGIFKSQLESMGVKFVKDGNILKVIGKVKDLKPANIITMPHPGFPTDAQAQTMLLLALIKGKSEIEETVFENRFMHVAEFNRMGANIKIHHNTAIIEGVDHLGGADVMASDLRAGAALVIAGLVARGQTRLNRIYHVDRGYEKLEEKLIKLGADIKREKFEI